MKKAITLYASRNPIGSHTQCITLSNFKPKRRILRSYGVNRTDDHWYYWGPKNKPWWTHQLSKEDEYLLGIGKLPAGCCQNLNTGEEWPISKARTM